MPQGLGALIMCVDAAEIFKKLFWGSCCHPYADSCLLIVLLAVLQGLGALIVRVDAAEILKKLFWGGGAVGSVRNLMLYCFVHAIC